MASSPVPAPSLRRPLTSRLLGATLDLPRPIKRLIALGIDAAVCLFTVWLAFYLRLGYWPHPAQDPAKPMLASVAIALPIFVSFGLYRAIFRYAGWPALMTIIRAVALYALAFTSLYTVIGISGTPRTVGIIQPILLLLFIASSRLVARVLFEESYTALWRDSAPARILIYGAGHAGRELASTLSASRDMKLVGFVDDDPALAGLALAGTTIHPSHRLEEVVRNRRVSEVLLAIPSASGARRSQIVGVLKSLGIHVRTLPSMTDIARGKVTVGDLKELDIADVLGRASVAPDEALLRGTIAGRTVLVTGAGGSIGSELCRQIALLEPARLVLVDHAEYNLYRIHRELEEIVAGLEADLALVPLLASVLDEPRIEAIFAAFAPQTVFHAAAYKHVPLVEHNPLEGIRNNAFGTLAVARIALAHEVGDFVFISTDKAVRPTNVMGATKRCAEMIIQALDQRDSRTRFSMVRFGNVLGSSGSVVPLFRKQVEAGGPVTLTDPAVTRYFMTIPEAAELVLQAGAMAVGGDVFVLDMGEPVRIIDLARSIIELSGRTVRDEARPDGDIEIRVLGLRPGEKLTEELLISGAIEPTPHPRIMRSREGFLPWNELEPLLLELSGRLAAGEAAEARAVLGRIVPEYAPNAPVVDWVSGASENAEGLAARARDAA